MKVWISEKPEPALPLFDSQLSEQAKETGMNQAAEAKKALLKYARELAIKLASGGKEISADDVQKALYEQGINIHALGNSAGSLFAGKQWEWTGRRIKSIRQHAHANEIKIWRLK